MGDCALGVGAFPNQSMGIVLNRLQGYLDFEDAVTPHFADENGVGRHGILGLGLGLICGLHLCVILLSQAASIPLPYSQWSAYVCLLCFFHASEWYVTAVYRPSELSYRSWIINHSVAYTFATLGGAAEFWLEYLLVPWLKGGLLWVVLMCILSAGALGIRVAGMVTAGKNFDHVVMTKKAECHDLVTTGVYSWLRHPAYFGWFYWVIAGQLLLANPLCTCAFAYVSHKFFSSRIPPEEATLVSIYGSVYTEYAARTPIGIPFVSSQVPYTAGGVATGSKTK